MPNERWSGYGNGEIPRSMLAEIPGGGGHRLRPIAAMALGRIITRFRRETGDQGSVLTDSYRDMAGQIDVKRRKGKYAATPGKSNHGYAEAADLRPNLYGWISRNAAWCREQGWYLPAWANDGKGIEEAWHHEYEERLDKHKNAGAFVYGPATPITPKLKDSDMIRKGDDGDNVAHLQRVINGALGRSSGGHVKGVSPLAADGEWGQKTSDALAHAKGRAEIDLGVSFPEGGNDTATAVTQSLLVTYVLSLGGEV